ncbi:unnamed protein product [Peniophora sp. CBMAI 1063]|nr:unnamed protein product [Peniophora sp. CBMAI 1063]
MAVLMDLPQELICQVFESATFSDPPRRREPNTVYAEDSFMGTKALRYTLGWVLLTHVNRPLRFLSFDMAHLWASVVTAIPYPDVVEEFLCRARDVNMTLHVYDRHPLRNPLRLTDLDMLAWAKLHEHRIETIICHPPHYMNNPREGLELWLKNTPLPHLRRIVFIPDAPYMSRELESIRAFNLSAPQLSHAEYWNTLHSAASTLHSLRTLRITISPTIPFLSVLLLVNTLRVTPKLEELNLRVEVEIPAMGHNYLPSPHIVPLQLHHLKVYDVTMKEEQFAYGLWETVDAPNVRSVTIHCNQPNIASRLSRTPMLQHCSRTSYTHLALEPHQLVLSRPNANSTEPEEVLRLSSVHSMEKEAFGEIFDALHALAATTLSHVRQYQWELPFGPVSSDRSADAPDSRLMMDAPLIGFITEVRRRLDQDSMTTTL